MNPLVVSLLVVLLLAGCDSGNSGSNNNTTPTPPPERIFFANGGQLGIFDASITRDPLTGYLWMSYSTVNLSFYYPPPLPVPYWAVGIRLAYSDDDGESWTDAGINVAPVDEPPAGVGPMTVAATSPVIDAGSEGIWQSETSALIYEPGNTNVNERWKQTRCRTLLNIAGFP